MNDSILDSLIGGMPDDLSFRREELIIPKRCAYCKCSTICSVLPTFISLSKIGICVGVEACPFSSPKKKSKDEENY
jgi:hypothetical protein